ncbi:hypothetical protein Y695_04080 [Hydrogenophaga sp. T4]|nr:hypothetical protein Y695_04080 [Hydrogenophaga sp. T4]
MPTSTQNASSTSNMVVVENSIHHKLVVNISADKPAVAGCCGHSRRASRNTRPDAPAENRGATRRGHHSLMPNNAQPTWNIQKKNGGLWL